MSGYEVRTGLLRCKSKCKNRKVNMQRSKDRARIKQQRIVKYFIEAANEIIVKEGIGAVTIRKAADLAGYASATLYNYFDSLPHLVFLATMSHMEEYNAAIPAYVAECGNSLCRYMSVCKCFAEYSYSEPEIYELLFFTHSDGKLEEYTQQYYDLYPEMIVKDWPAPLSKIYCLNSIYSRSFMQLEDCINDGFIERNNAIDFNDVSLRVYKSILQEVRDGVLKKDAAISLTLKYYVQLLECYMEPGHSAMLKDVARNLA